MRVTAQTAAPRDCITRVAGRTRAPQYDAADAKRGELRPSLRIDHDPDVNARDGWGRMDGDPRY